jgi:exonuclease SbcD
MRILHTADWHLGADLKRVPRLDDQLARVEELLAICDEREVDLLLVAGDFIDESRGDRMTPILRRLGGLLRPPLARGMQAVVIAGNHDRESVFPLLQTARELFSLDGEGPRLHFVAKPGLRVMRSAAGEQVRLLCLPYPRQSAYDLEAIVFHDSADRHRQLADAVKQRIRTFEDEIRGDSRRMPTVVMAHLLVAGQRENGHELTEEADVPVPRVFLPNYAYVALGHVHQPTPLGSVACRYSGSIERMDFGEVGAARQVVLVELDSSGLAAQPEVIDLHPTDLREIEWREGDDLAQVARGIPSGAICRLKLMVPPGTNVQALQAQARDLIPRLCWPPEVTWQGDAVRGVPTGSLAMERADWRGAVRRYVAEQVAADDPMHDGLVRAVEELLAEEAPS